MLLSCGPIFPNTPVLATCTRTEQRNKKGNMKKYERCLQQSRWLGETPGVPAILTPTTQRQKGGGGIEITVVWAGNTHPRRCAHQRCLVSRKIRNSRKAGFLFFITLDPVWSSVPNNLIWINLIKIYLFCSKLHLKCNSVKVRKNLFLKRMLSI